MRWMVKLGGGGRQWGGAGGGWGGAGAKWAGLDGLRCAGTERKVTEMLGCRALSTRGDMEGEWQNKLGRGGPLDRDARKEP